QNLAELHWRVIKCVIKYLYMTCDQWLMLGRPLSEPEIYADVDWASQTHRQPISGFAVKLGASVILWSSKKQPVIALSSAEAKYIAATRAAKEMLWLRVFLTKLGRHPSSLTKLCTDNQSAIAISKDPKFHAMTKHI